MIRHRPPSVNDIRELLTRAGSIAIVGASSDPSRPSHGVMRRLQSAGYRVFPVNPNEREVLGVPSYGSLAELPQPVDIVDVFRRPEATPAIADEAVAAGAGALWLQQGIVNDDAAARATRGGLMVVMDRCIAVDLVMLGVPRRSLGGPSGG
jgi:predicted CoA-binding protein